MEDLVTASWAFMLMLIHEAGNGGTLLPKHVCQQS